MCVPSDRQHIGQTGIVVGMWLGMPAVKQTWVNSEPPGVPHAGQARLVAAT
jgi:hypothetical protein